jgi:uncharacterized alpha-E superfamily protein
MAPVTWSDTAIEPMLPIVRTLPRPTWTAVKEALPRRTKHCKKSSIARASTPQTSTIVQFRDELHRIVEFGADVTREDAVALSEIAALIRRTQHTAAILNTVNTEDA